MEAAKLAELRKRRKQRIEQVREQSKIIASELRRKVNAEKKRKAEELAKIKCKELREWQENQLRDMKNQCTNVHGIGRAHKEAMEQVDPQTVLRQSKKSQDDAARIREKEAIKTLKSEMLEKQSKKKVKQKSFRSLPISSTTPKVKITQTIKKGRSAKKKKVPVCHYDQEVEINAIDLEEIDSDLNKTNVSIPYRKTNVNKNKSDILINISQDADIFKSNEWLCDCCKIHRDVGTQCICSKTLVKDFDKENLSSASDLNDRSVSNEYFTQVSDRIKTRKIIDVPSIEMNSCIYNPDDFSDEAANLQRRNNMAYSEPYCDNQRIVEQEEGRRYSDSSSSSERYRDVSPSTKMQREIDAIRQRMDKRCLITNYKNSNPINIKYKNPSPSTLHKKASPHTRKLRDANTTRNNKRDSSPLMGLHRDVSPLTEISVKIQDGIKCAKECLENIEPDVLELQKNVECLSREKSQVSESAKSVKPISPIKSVKPNTELKSSSVLELPKVKLYDNSTKYEAMYKPSTTLVEKVDSKLSCARDMAQKESEIFDKEVLLRAQRRKDALAKSKIRSREALSQSRNMKNLENINKCFESLTLLEKESDACKERSLCNISSYKDLYDKKQEKIDEAFNNIVDKGNKGSKNVITLERTRKTKSSRQKGTSENCIPHSSYLKSSNVRKESRLNVGILNDKDSICNKNIIDICCNDDKSSSTSSSIVIGHLDQGNAYDQDALRELLNRVNRQKQMLLEEVPETDLPQDSKLNDVLDAVQKSLLEPQEPTQNIETNNVKNDMQTNNKEEIREIKKKKKKIAKKEEELKFKELQLDLLIQKHKLNDLEEKTKAKDDKLETEILLPEKDSTDKLSVISLEPSNKDQCDVIGKPSSNSVEIVIHVKDKSKKKNISTPRKFLVHPRGASSIHKHKKSKNKLKMSKMSTPRKNSSVSCSSSSSTSYLSLPAELINVSKLAHIPKALVIDYTKEQFQKQTNKDDVIYSKSPTKSGTSSRFDRANLKAQKSKTNPLLASYINRLLSMDRDTIDALTVSSCSDVPTPSNSVINIPTNKIVKDKTKNAYFSMPTDSLINNESSRMVTEVVPDTIIRQNMEAFKTVPLIEETPKRSKRPSLQSRGIQVSTIHSNTLEDVSTNNISSTQIPEKVDENEDMQDLTDNCNRRITNLANLINKVRQEKLKLLECSLSSGSSYGQNSTEYLDLPSHISSPLITKRQNTDLINKTSDTTQDIYEESPPHFEVTDEIHTTDAIEFTPMLKDIPKPSEIQNITTHHISENTNTIEYGLNDLQQNMVGINKQLGKLENYMGQIHEYIGDVAKQKQKPPVSLFRQLKNIVNIDAAQAHELSAIMEVDTKVSETVTDVVPLEDSIISSNQEKTSSDSETMTQNIAEQEVENTSVFSSRLKNIFENTDINIILKSPDKSHETTPLNIEVNPFPTFEEYSKKLESKAGASVAVNDENYGKNDETLPDVLSELIRRNILQKPFENDTQNSDVSVTDSQLLSKLKLNDIPSISHASITLLSDSSIGNTSTSTSTPQEIEKALQKLGMNWALNTLKKTQESIEHSSSSSLDYPSPKTSYLTKKILALKTLNEQTLKELENSHQPLPPKIAIESSMTESIGKVKRISQTTEYPYNYDKSLDKEDFASLVKKAQNLSLDKESIFRRLLSTSKDLSNATDNITLIKSSQTNQRTSTPVFNDKRKYSSSNGNSLNETLFSGSNLSSVRSNSSDNANEQQQN